MEDPRALHRGESQNGWVWPLALLIGFMTLIGACCCTVMFNNSKEQRLREIDMHIEWQEEQKDIKAFNYALKVNARAAEQALIEQAQQEEYQQQGAYDQQQQQQYQQQGAYGAPYYA